MKFIPLVFIVVAIMAFTAIMLTGVHSFEQTGTTNITMTESMNGTQNAMIDAAGNTGTLLSWLAFFGAVMCIVGAGMIMWSRLV